MVENLKQAGLVGSFIRQRREALNLSQRALGLMFSPPVTTQFISNVERGVTPLPPSHIAVLSKSLSISETELLVLLEKEYTMKLSRRLGRPGEDSISANGLQTSQSSQTSLVSSLPVDANDFEFMRHLYDAYRQADTKTRAAFSSVCDSLLNPAKFSGKPTSNNNSE